MMQVIGSIFWVKKKTSELKKYTEVLNRSIAVPILIEKKVNFYKEITQDLIKILND